MICNLGVVGSNPTRGSKKKESAIRYEVVANAFSEMVTRLGQIPEWPNGADCKSAVFRLRWFESIFAHNVLKKRMQTGFDSLIFKMILSLFVCKFFM